MTLILSLTQSYKIRFVKLSFIYIS